MTKLKFLLALNERLSSLPRTEVEERLGFYSEMIEDRMEEGLSEEESVACIGSVDEIAAQILSESTAGNKDKKTEEKEENPADDESTSKKTKRSRDSLPVWAIVLLILGSPVWLSLLVALVSVIISVYAVLWSVIAALWAVFGALIGAGFGGVFVGTALAVIEPLPGIAVIAAAMVCAGLSIFAFLGCAAATAGAARLTKIIFFSIKRLFFKKEVK